jgi:hypothetical protein
VSSQQSAVSGQHQAVSDKLSAVSNQRVPSSTLYRLPDPFHDEPRVFVCLHRGVGLISELIRWHQRGAYSHASLWFPGRGVIESREFKGVRALPCLQPSSGEVIDLFAIDGITREQEEQLFAFAQRQLGKPYDWPMVWGFVSRSPVEGHESAGQWFCSELAFAAPAAAGIELLARIDAWEVSPPILRLAPRLRHHSTRRSP